MPQKKIEIFKIQTDFGMESHLIYNKGRSIDEIIPFDEGLFELCNFKGFVEAYIGAGKKTLHY